MSYASLSRVPCLQREVLNELNGLDQQLAVLDTELSQKEGLATQLHRQLAGVRERLARQGRGPLSGLPAP